MSYNETAKQEAGADIPMCTLKSFPYLIEHCIEWSRDRFFTIFEQQAEDACNFCKNPDYYYNHIKVNDMKALQSFIESTDLLTSIKEAGTFEACI